ncbi:rhodanese-like domain-containing protein [Mucilaginibacter gotjawali]|uniref:Adenylyltransferase/sulfurtransferase n=2 Tax=Mucilaginibacter gotjawali TaxID=1550579 RepID=A0A839SIU5_9SPHI|nr:rhodanese-like domain-containing protein [Mucilaginibacter gotjawali]MBB3058195.1 adenylyltransferase/sulfurtransferase [Mucilaginibacter gotjawali]BAU54849.1 putative adenylyltransferase/sulfurtransferase MoeZ [Mucilaginibacter gotjawali]
MHSPIEANELLHRMNAGESLNLLDVRGVIEFHTYNIGGNNIPLPVLAKTADSTGYNKKDEIIVICKVGLRSETASRILKDAGFENVRNLTGGLIALQKLK